MATLPANRALDPFGGGIPVALLAIAVTFAGFYPSFFSNPASLDSLHLVHGVSSYAWLLLVLVQASLIRVRKLTWHRTIGWSSLALFAVLVVTSWQMVGIMLSGASGMPFDLAKVLAFSDLATLPLFVLLYAGALWLRRDRHVHSRLISATVLVGMIPALGRMLAMIPALGGLSGALHPTYAAVLAVLAVAIAADWRAGRLRWPFPFAFAWFASTYALLFPVSASSWFDGIASSIAGAGI
ncbi:MAG: hypothetical protein ABIP41_06810 [Croceibacterium sp.]